MATNHHLLASHHHHHPFHSSSASRKNSAPNDHQVAPETVVAAAAAVAASSGHHHHKGHQRRQSVARLLPDISKLRLLSWLVEASSELINCDIAIMDGVYAKLNKSQESLLFWSSTQQQQQQQQLTPMSVKKWQPQPPPRPSKQPVANQSLVKMISEQQQQSTKHNKHHLHKKTKESRLSKSSSRNHHSLPLANYDASSLAAVSLSPSLGHQSIASSSLSAATAPALAAAVARHSAARQLQQQQRAVVIKSCDDAAQECPPIICDSSSGGGSAKPLAEGQQKQQPEVDEHKSDDEEAAADDDDGAGSNAGASSTTSSSGVQGSLSSSDSCSSSGSFSCSAADSTSTTSSSSSSSHHSSSSAASSCSNDDHHHHHQHHHHLGRSGAPPFESMQQRPQLSSAERLSEKIRRTVMEHNHLQNLLVNIIRQHDRLRDQLNQQRRRQLSFDLGGHHGQQRMRLLASRMAKIDLADIAEALDDGCSCGCHSQRASSRTLGVSTTVTATTPPDQSKGGKRASTLPHLLSSSASASASASTTSGGGPLKVRRFKKLQLQQRNTLASTSTSSSSSTTMTTTATTATTTTSTTTSNNNSEQQAAKNRQEALSLLADKLCENCFETHYWLHGCGSLDLMSRDQMSLSAPDPESTTPSSAVTSTGFDRIDDNYSRRDATDADDGSTGCEQQLEQNNAIIAKRNATFIKLVQQETRSTISKSIELIDLIRKEIKSPESIKHKQLMRCFSSSIQLLTSVGNYVVPSQDISAIIPEASLQQQTQLFSLPSSDFDHLLMNGNYSFGNLNSLQLQQQQHQQHQQSNYHLAPVPEIPIRRQINLLHPRFLSNGNNGSYQSSSVGGGGGGAKSQATSLSLIHERSSDTPTTTTATTSSNKNNRTTITKDSNQVMSSSDNNNCQSSIQQQQQAVVKKGGAGAGAESSSGASSNNSSASSSIARGTVQQSSLTRAHTSSAILVGANHQKQQRLNIINKTTSHDLSLEQFANLSRHHQTEDDLILPSRPKFWQSSKFNFIKKLLHVKQQRLLRQQSKDRRIYNNKVQNKFRLVMMDLTHFNKSQQLLTTENGVNSLLTSMRNVLEFGLYLTLKLY